MTAPEDLDNDDRGLAGEETFDLGEGENEARRRGRNEAVEEIVGEKDGMDSESESEQGEGEEEEEVFDSDEERELKLGALEGELDGMYDDYQSRMAERDAKYKVKQQRLKDRNYDAWHGIQEDAASDGGESDDDIKKRIKIKGRGDVSEEEEDEGEGGWDVRLASKAKLGESDDEDSDDEDKPKKKVKAKSAFDAPEKPTKSLINQFNAAEKRQQMSRQAQLWFDQSVFKGVDDLAALDGEEEEEEEEEDAEMDEVAEEEDVEMQESSEETSSIATASDVENVGYSTLR